MILGTILFVDELPFLHKFPPHNFEHFFCVYEDKKVFEQFLLIIFGTEVLISLISSLGGWWGVGGCYS